MNLDPQHLLSFATVARRLHITSAAEELGLSQPAVSKQVKLLEKALGANLVERAGRGIRLTDAGTTLAKYALELQTLLEEAKAALADVRGLRSGSLVVAASPTIATYLIPRILVRYRLKFPGISLRVEVEQSAAMTTRLLEGKLDLALSEVPPMVDRFVARVFMRDRLQPIVPAGHPLVKCKKLGIAEFLKAGLIVRESQSLGESFLEQELRRLRMDIQPILRVNSTEAAKEAVAAGLGVAIVSGLAAAAESGRSRLVRVRLKDCNITRPLYVIRPTSGQPSKAAKAFLCMLDHAVRGSLLPVVRRNVAQKRG